MSEITDGAAKGGRAENGQFTPGNPFARRSAELRKAAQESASARDVREVMAAIKIRAQRGDVAAARLWLSYSVGRPGAAADPDTIDSHDLQVRRKNVATQEDVKALSSLPASLMCKMAGAAAPFLHGHLAKTLAEGLRKGLPAEPTAAAPEAPGRDNPVPGHDALLRQMREGLPGGLKEGNDCRLVPEPDAGRAKDKAGKNGRRAS